MEAFGISTDKLINPNIRILFLPIISLIMLIIIFITSANIAYPLITSQLEEIEESKNKTILLEEKLTLLREVKEKILADADTSLLAVPSNNPSLWTLTQFEISAKDNLVEISDKKVKTERKTRNELFVADLEFSAKGDINNVISFLQDAKTYAPLISLEKIELDARHRDKNAEVKVVVYRADLPTMLPAITTPIKNLSSTEQQLLDQLAKLTTPEYTTLDPVQYKERADPFR